MDRLKDKVAVVTGGASGIGKAIADLFRQEGAQVFVLDPAEEGVFSVDVSREDQVAAAMKAVFETAGRLDILVNNAGFAGTNKATHEVSEAEWDAVFAVDVKGVLFCTKHALPYMLQAGGGSIVNLSSVYGTHGSRGDLTAYHAAKGAVTTMTKQDAVTYGKQNIRVNAIHPGAIVTPLLQKWGSQFPGGWEAFKAYSEKRYPVGHMGTPEDVAYGALYLASDEAKFVTGVSLYIDGGYTAW